MKTLAEAWDWYESTRISLEQMQRIGSKYWAAIPWGDEPPIARDDTFRMLESEDIVKATSTSLALIDDLAVVVLFSVFESLVRQHLITLIEPEIFALRNPISIEAVRDAIEGVHRGSFYRKVMEPLKDQGLVTADLVTRVDQVRNYRNWVAHGRGEGLKNNVDPRESYTRLVEFLDAIGLPKDPEGPSVSTTG